MLSFITHFVVYNLAILLFFILAVFVYQITHRNSYYYTLGWNLYTREKTFEKNSKKIVLLGMIHVALPEFYKTIQETYNKDEFKILLEGVTDKNNLLSKKITYEFLAEMMSLKMQDRTMFDKDAIKADVDLSDLHPSAVAKLNTIFDLFEKFKNFVERGEKFDEKAADYKDLLDKKMRNEIVYKRNDHLFSQIMSYMEQEKPLVIPWGAAHLKDIEERIVKLGYRPVQTRSFKSINIALALKNFIVFARKKGIFKLLTKKNAATSKTS